MIGISGFRLRLFPGLVATAADAKEKGGEKHDSERCAKDCSKKAHQEEMHQLLLPQAFSGYRQ